MSRPRGGVPAVVAVAADTLGTRELVALLNTSTVYDRSQLLADRKPHALHACDVTVDESAVAAGPRITIDAAWRTVPNAAEVRIVIACAPGGHFQSKAGRRIERKEQGEGGKGAWMRSRGWGR